MDVSPKNTRILLRCTDGLLPLDLETVSTLNLPIFNAANGFGGYQDEFRLDEYGVSRTAVAGLISLMQVWREKKKIEQEDVNRASGSPLELYRAADFLSFDAVKKQLLERLYTDPAALCQFGKQADDIVLLADSPEAMQVKKLLGGISNVCGDRTSSKHYLCAVTDQYGNAQTHVFDKITGECLFVIDGKQPEISPNEEFVAVQVGEWPHSRCIKLWNLKTGECLGDFGCGGYCQFSPDSKFLHYYSGDTCCVWDIEAHKCIFQQALSAKNGIADFCGNTFLRVSDKIDGIYGQTRHEHLFDVRTSKCLAHGQDEIGSVQVLNDGQLFAAAAYGRVRVTDAAGNLVLERVGKCLRYEHDCLDIANGDVYSKNTEREIWNTTTMKCLCTYRGYEPQFSANGTMFFVRRNDEQIDVYSVDGTCLFECQGEEAKFSPNGTKLGVIIGGMVIVYDVHTKEILVQDQCPKIVGISHIFYLTDDYLILQDDFVKIFNLTTKNVIEFEGTFRTNNWRVPTLLAIETSDKSLIKVFDLAQQAVIKVLPGNHPRFLEDKILQYYDHDRGCHVVYSLQHDQEIFSKKGLSACNIEWKDNMLSSWEDNGLHNGWVIRFVDRKPCVRILFQKLILQRGILSDQERFNLYPIYQELSDTEKSAIIAGRKISEIFQAPAV